MSIQELVVDREIKLLYQKISEIIEPEFRFLGIKGDLTKGKLKWHGIKLLIDDQYLGVIKCQLIKRGKLIKSFSVEYGDNHSSTNPTTHHNSGNSKD